MVTKKTTAKAPVCALEGCNRKLKIQPTGRPGKYCCDLHRAMAGKVRARVAREMEREEATGCATATNSAPPGAPTHLVITTPRSGRTPKAEGAAVATSHGTAHQRGSGTSTIRYSTHVVMHVQEETIERTTTPGGGH